MAKRKSKQPAVVIDAAEAMGEAVGKAMAALESAVTRKRRGLVTSRTTPGANARRSASADRSGRTPERARRPSRASRTRRRTPSKKAR